MSCITYVSSGIIIHFVRSKKQQRAQALGLPTNFVSLLPHFWFPACHIGFPGNPLATAALACRNPFCTRTHTTAVSPQGLFLSLSGSCSSCARTGRSMGSCVFHVPQVDTLSNTFRQHSCLPVFSSEPKIQEN